MTEIRVIDTLHEIDRRQWDACFPGEAEGYDYLLAVEESALVGFSFRYLTAWRDRTLMSATPLFLTHYSLDTTLQGVGKKVTAAIKSALPNLLTVKLACLGSPCTETGAIGFHPELNGQDKHDLLAAMLDYFETYAAAQACNMIGIKDIPEPFQERYAEQFQKAKFSTVPGLPTAWLEIDFSSIDEYLSRLSAGTRKDMRRKLRSMELLRVEYKNDIDLVLPEIMALYHDTRNRSEWQFEELTPGYFQQVLERMGERAFCALYYHGSRLLAANLLVHGERALIDKFFCMKGAEGRAFNIYFLSWFHNLRYCLEHGYTRYQSGQAYYENKLRLGSRLTRNMMYFKHRNVLAQGLLKFAAPLLSADETMAVAP
jgi:predicted N-acyltransferase